MNKNQQFEKIYPLSKMQQGMLFNYLKDKRDKAYFEQIELHIAGDIDVELLKRSFNLIIERHDVLRTNFVYQKMKVPRQVVFKEKSVEINYEDICLLEEHEKLIRLEKFKEEDLERGFDLTKDNLVRMAIIRFDKEEYKIIWSYHHIIMDGWSFGIIFKELMQVYSSYKQSKNLKLSNTYSYGNYIEWLSKQDKEEAIKYWKEYLEGYQQQIIPYIHNDDSLNEGYINKAYMFSIDVDLTKRMENIAAKYKTTLSTLFQTIWGILLQKYNNVDDVVFGTVVSGRPPEIEGIEDTVGLFINTIPMRVKCKGEEKFIDVARQFQQDIVSSSRLDYCSLADIQSLTPLNRELINNIIAFENYPLDEEIGSSFNEDIGISFKDLKIRAQNNYDFNIVVSLSNALQIKFEYNELVYDIESIKRIHGHIEKVVRTIVNEPSIAVKDIEIITEQERSQILYEFNNTQLEYPKDKTLQELFEEQVEKVPNNVAVIFEDKYLTYRELNAKSNQVARALRHKGVKSDSIVGIMIERSLDIIVGILGILKAGGAYLPIDIEYPKTRITYMLENSSASILLTQKCLMDRVDFRGEIIDIEDELISKECSSNLELINNSHDLAYVIYTSGSTGNPKGAMIEHTGMLNHIYAKIRELKLNEKSIIAQNASYCFDISVWQLLTPLIIGGQTVIYSKERVLNIEEFMCNIVSNKVSILEVVPSYLSAMLTFFQQNRNDLSFLKYVLVTGEELKRNLVARWFNEYPNIKMINAYGPTEAADDITHFIVNEKIDYNSIPIGRPLQNLNIYIVGDNMNLCPIGVVGEIVVSGIGVGRGYINDKQKTEQVFAEDTFKKEYNTRLYKTGDLGKWMPDGNIEFCGRKDYQVKIRGFRIELGEIENKLLQCEKVKNVVVVDKEGADGEKYLCAYVVKEEALNVEDLRTYLAKEVPNYMIPSYFIEIDKLPLNSNGKVDRKILPDPKDNLVIGMEYKAPANEVEKKLADIWEEVLGIERIGTNYNFFEIGGNSISILEVMSLINKEFEMDISLSELFLNPTIEGIASNIYKEDEINKLKCVVRLNKVTPGKENIFIIHEQKGIIYLYKELAKLLEGECNFYGIQARGLIDNSDLPKTLDEMVMEYINEMKIIQPQGPYIIGGYCYGVRLGYEMVRKLEIYGDAVKKFIIIDEGVYIPDTLIKVIRLKKSSLRSLEPVKKGIEAKEVSSMERWTQEYSNEKVVKKLIDKEREKSVEENIIYLAGTTLKVKGIIDSSIAVIKAKETLDPRISIDHWSKMTDGTVSLCEISGDHNSIFSYPDVQGLANSIKEAIFQ